MTKLTASFHACHISNYPFVNVNNPIFSDFSGGGGGGDFDGVVG